MDKGNIFQAVPERIPAEQFDDLLKEANLRIERIISDGHATPEGRWYDQDLGEWVMLLQGGAALRFEDREELVTLKPGDWINIPAHARHRVEWTDPDRKTIWVAVHYRVDVS